MASSSQAPTHQRNGKGRQKVRMVKIENKSNLLVTFSKRRSGLFKKASELCTLTGSKIGVIVFSPGRKVFSFGHPSVHNIINECFPEMAEGVRARNDVVLMPRFDERLVEAHRNVSVAEHNMWLSKVEMRMEVLKQWTIAIDEREKAEMEGHVKIEEMMEGELVEMGVHLNALQESMASIGTYGAMPDQATSLHPVLGDMGNSGLGPMGNLGLGPMGNLSSNPIGGVKLGSCNFY